MVMNMSVFIFWVVMLCGLNAALNIKAVCSSKMLVSTCKSTQHYYPEDQQPTLTSGEVKEKRYI
jgi:hypothetical protein